MNMIFADFCKVREAEVRPRVRKHTWLTKVNIFECKFTNMCFSALDIAERVGHETIGNTYRYANLFPAKRALVRSLCLRRTAAIHRDLA